MGAVQNVLNGFNGTQITNYSAAIQGLNVNQARLLLTTQGLNAERSKEILIEAGLLASENAIQAELIETALIKAGLNKEERDEILRKLGLITVLDGEAVAQGTCTAEDLKAVLAQKLKNATDAEGILNALGLAGANTTVTASFGLLTKAIWANIKAIAAWLVSNPIGWIILIGTTVFGVTKAITGYNEALEESRQEMIETGKQAAQLEDDLNGLVEQYRQLGKDGTLDSSDREQAKNIQQQINDLLGESVGYIDLANGKYETQLKLLRRIQYDSAIKNHAEIKEAKVAAEDSLLNTVKVKALTISGGAFTTQSEMDAYDNFLKTNGFSKYAKVDDVGDKVFRAEINGVEDAVDVYDDLVKIKDILSTEYEAEIEKGGELYDFYNEIDKKIKEMSDSVQKYKDAIADYDINEAVIQFNKTEFGGIKGVLIDSKEELVSWMDAMLASDEVSDGVTANLIGLANTYYPQYADAIQKSVEAHLQEKAVTLSMEAVQDGEIGKLYKLGKQYGLTEHEIVNLIATQTIFNNSNLNVAGKIQALGQLQAQLGITTSKAIGLNTILANIGNDSRAPLTAAYQYGVKRNPSGWEYNGKTYKDLTTALNNAMYDEFMSSIEGYTGGGTINNDNDDDDSKEKNTPSYEDPTDAIINRINLRSKELKQEEEEIENEIELAELEEPDDNSYKKRISLTDALIKKRKSLVDELKQANIDISNEAEYLRNSNPWDEESWFDSQGEFTEAYYKDLNSAATAEAQDNIKTLGQNLQKYKKAYADNAKDIINYNKEILKDEKNIADIREESYNEAASEIQRYVDRVTDYYDKINEGLDKRIKKEEAILQITQKHTDVTGNFMDAQTELDKALRDSMLSTEYLTEDERAKIFNEDDYKHLSSVITSTQSDIDTLTANFMQQIEDAYANDQLYLVEAITAEYERQVDMKERELEIAKAQVDLAKKQLQLNNVLAEKNVKQLVERNGQFVWEWVADSEKVRQATEEYMDAEAKIKRAEYDKNQQLILNGQQSIIDGLNAQKGLNSYHVETLNDYVDDITLAIENSIDPIQSFSTISGLLDGASDDVLSAFNKITSSVLGTHYGAVSSSGIISTSKSSAGASNTNFSSNDPNYVNWVQRQPEYKSWAKQQMATNSLKWHTASDSEKKELEAENQRLGESIGSVYDEVTGTWKHKYATGSKYTLAGKALMGEDGEEIFITKNGRLIPINQPTIGNIGAGGIVFNREQMTNLRSIWDMSNIGKFANDLSGYKVSSSSQVTSKDTIFSGDINVYSPHDYNDFVKALTQRMQQKNI